MRRLRFIVMTCLCVACIAAIGEDEDYVARKRRLHEQATGERLDADGHVRRPRNAVEVKRPKLMAAAKASSPLTVSNVKISQRKDSKLVDVTYDLSGGSAGKCNVTAEFCDNNTCIYARTFDGDIGDGT